jgi:hypothetical protein
VTHARSRLGWSVAAWLVACALPAMARAQVQSPMGFRLESTGFGGVQPGMALLMLQGSGEAGSVVSADALVWGGIGTPGEVGQADVLVVALRLRDPEGRTAGQLGRFIVSPGALRPLHIDGASGWVRLPGDFRLEAFGGTPVVPRFGERAYDWAIGTRLSRALGDWGSLGVAYGHQRLGGSRADEEIGFDVGVHVAKWLDLNGRASYDLINPGFSEVLGSASIRHADWRLELFYTERSPSRILPATSLFSVLGDVPSRRTAATIDYRVAPRLRVSGVAGMRWIGDRVGESLQAKAELKLDDRGQSAIIVQGTRESAPDGQWTGMRAAARLRLAEGWTAATEIELVFPDTPQQGGKVWPWGLLGIEWKVAEQWDLGLAVMSSASPQLLYRTDALVRVTHRLEVSR